MPRRIFIIGDDRPFRELLTNLSRRDYDVVAVEDGEACLREIEVLAPDLVLLDATMPGVDGYEVCRRVKSSPAGRHVQIIVVSAQSSGSEQIRALEAGADDYVTKPVQPDQLRSKVCLHLQLRDALSRLTPGRKNVESYDSGLEQLVAEQMREIIASHGTSLLALRMLAESREPEGGERLVRLRYYCSILAGQLSRAGPHAGRIDVRFLKKLFRSVPLHDIGKVGINDSILLKQGPLTPEEVELVKQHTTIGAVVLDQAECDLHSGDFLAMAKELARWHHERFDGTGYPMGLKGEEIPLAARILALAEEYDVLTSSQNPRAACHPQIAREIIERESGKGFDPVVVDAFRNCFEELVDVQKQLSDHNPLVQGAAAFVD